MDETNLGRQNISKLQSAAEQFTNKCPQLSAFYHSQCKRTEDALDLPETPKHISCQYCGSLYNPGNYKVQVKPKMKLNKKIRKLLLKENDGYHLGKFQMRLLKMYRESKNKLVLTCLTCHKRTMVPGRGRVVVSKQKHLEAPSKSMVDLSLLSKSSRKKLKKKEKLKQKTSGVDSGLDLSFTSSSLSQRTKSASSEDPRSQSSSVSRSTLSPAVFKSPYNTSVITQPSPIYTSTPIVGAGNKAPGGQVKKLSLLSGPPPAAVLFGTGLNTSDGGRKKKGKKDKKGMLQRMLAAQNKQSDDSNNSSLSAFLSSL